MPCGECEGERVWWGAPASDWPTLSSTYQIWGNCSFIKVICRVRRAQFARSHAGGRSSVQRIVGWGQYQLWRTAVGTLCVRL